MRASPRLRRFRSSTERGIMWLMLTGSPVSGSGMRHSSGYRCWRSKTPASVWAAPARAGCAVTSSTDSSPSHTVRRVLRSLSRNCSPVRAPKCVLPRAWRASARRRRRSCLGEPRRVKRRPGPPLYYAVAMMRPEANEDRSRDRNDLPYEGLVVVDLSQGVAGPHCGMLFALNGADVIKVEPPAGDWGRSIGRRYGDFSAYGVAFNRGKRSVAIDIKSPEGRELAAR